MEGKEQLEEGCRGVEEGGFTRYSLLTTLINSKSSTMAELRRLYLCPLFLNAVTTGSNNCPLMM